MSNPRKCIGVPDDHKEMIKIANSLIDEGIARLSDNQSYPGPGYTFASAVDSTIVVFTLNI